MFFGNIVSVYGVDLVSREEHDEFQDDSELSWWGSDHRHDLRWPSNFIWTTSDSVWVSVHHFDILSCIFFIRA